MNTHEQTQQTILVERRPKLRFGDKIIPLWAGPWRMLYNWRVQYIEFHDSRRFDANFAAFRRIYDRYFLSLAVGGRLMTSTSVRTSCLIDGLARVYRDVRSLGHCLDNVDSWCRVASAMVVASVMSFSAASLCN